MKKSVYKTLTILFLLLSFNFYSQITISYGKNYTFSNLEVAEASVSDKGISLLISEVDTRNLDYDGSKVKPHYKLLIDVNSLKNLKFPITPTDSVMFNTTSLQQNLNFNLKADKYLKGAKGKKLDLDAKKLKQKAASKQERINALSKRVANGDMSAMKELQKITSEMASDAENIAKRVTLKEEKDKATFDLVFIDNKSFVENKLLAGKIYIKEFSKNKFIAEFSGKFITECLDKKQDCKKQKSKLIPQIKIYKEGEVKGQISVSLKKVNDDR